MFENHSGEKLDPSAEGPDEFEAGPTVKEQSPFFVVDRAERSKFILESLRNPTADLVEAGKTAPEKIPVMVKDIVATKLKDDPQLGGEPPSEKDVRITIALIAEGIRREAESKKDEATKNAAARLIVVAIGVGPAGLGEFVRGASMLKGVSEVEDADLEEKMRIAGL
jgi:hypothetical protein